MEKKINLLGHEIEIKSKGKESKSTGVKKEDITKAIETLKKYKAGKESLEGKIIENERWYKSQHWEIVKPTSSQGEEPEPTTAFLFSVLTNKHADAMDNYPNPNVVEREESDAQEAETLSDILPVVLERNRFKKTWNRSWWYKLKQGFVVYGVFWNPELENGLGDIDVKRLDALNVYWEPGKEDIQDSRNLFIVDLVDIDLLEEEYPEIKGKIGKDAQLQPKQYVTDDAIDTEGKAVVVDWYYKKKNTNGENVLHLTKFVGQEKLASTEDEPETRESGLYEHGQYPIFLDVLFPMEGSPAGFGFIDVVKNPQMYIDKMDQIISRNALISGKQRFLYSKNSGINIDELKDFGNDFIGVEGSIEERHIKEFQAKPLDAFISAHRQNKISELKEIASNNDFDRGGGGKGVTAASAIQALQEAANKQSRDMISDSYETYTHIVYMCIELIAQFYTEERKFRIKGPGGEPQYIRYSNEGLQPEKIRAYESEGMIENPEWNPEDESSHDLIEDPEYDFAVRKPIFDIKVKPEKNNPFSRAALNEMAKEMYQLGFFNPERALEAEMALDMMTFEGKDTLVTKVRENANIMAQMGEMKNTMDKMAKIIEATTGQSLSDEGPGELI